MRITLFGVSEVTKHLPPVFPLLYHERFHFQKVFKKIGCLPLLESKLSRIPITLQLIQYPECTTATVKLANFKAHLEDLLFPPNGADLNLMFSPTKSYPGIIAPIAEVSTRLSLNESEVEDGTMSTLPITIYSKSTREKSRGIFSRQKSVCHTKHNLYCNCFNKKSHLDLKKFLPTNKRRSAQWERRDFTIYPAHIKSHKNFNDELFQGFKSESIPNTSDIDSDELKTDGKYCRPGEYKHSKYQEEEYPSSSNSNDYIRAVNNNSKPEVRYYYPENSCNQKCISVKDDGLRRSANSPCTFVQEDYERPHNEERDISRLKRELKKLLEEEEKECHNKYSNKCEDTKEKAVVCCLCCPKERNANGFAANPQRILKCKRCISEDTPSCSECFISACRKAHDEIQDPNKTTLEEDIRKRPLFYSNLYTAYQKLGNKRNKKPMWR